MNEIETDNRADRRLDIQQRPTRRVGGEWIGGAILILLGLLLVSQNLNIISLNNWWALFILLPAIGTFSAAWKVYQTEGRFSMGARAAAIAGLMFTLVSAMFLFEVSWTIVGPVLLILAGVALCINALFPDKAI